VSPATVVPVACTDLSPPRAELNVGRQFVDAECTNLRIWFDKGSCGCINSRVVIPIYCDEKSEAFSRGDIKSLIYTG